MQPLTHNDPGLLELARVVLEHDSYTVTDVPATGGTVLLAEDENNVVVVAAVISPPQIIDVEPLVSRVLTERLVEAHVPEKRWDGYVVLLCAQTADSDQTEALAGLANNLRQLRRVVRVGVEPTRAAVSRALRPLLPLPTPVSSGALTDPLELLRGRLLRDGLDPEAVHDVLEDFKIDAGIPFLQDGQSEVMLVIDEEGDVDE
jgi:hypothetical protein